jgi:hypothetical protein
MGRIQPGRMIIPSGRIIKQPGVYIVVEPPLAVVQTWWLKSEHGTLMKGAIHSYIIKPKVVMRNAFMMRCFVGFV